jgi:hypothetical protein
MDEIDAALDFRNVSIVANYIKDRTKNAQFIIISLRFVEPLFNPTQNKVLIIFDLETTCLNSVIASSESIRPPMLLEVRVQTLPLPQNEKLTRDFRHINR